MAHYTFMEVIGIQVQSYKDNKTEKLCTDYNHAKKKLDSRTAEKLFSLLEFVRSADTLKDVASMPKYNVHSLKGKRAGQIAIDIDGRKSSYRLIIEPVDKIDEKLIGVDFLSKCYSIKVISIMEVSNHYE